MWVVKSIHSLIMYNTTLKRLGEAIVPAADKIEHYAVMLCDVLYMHLKTQQLCAHKRSIREEINMDYHQSKIDHINNHGIDAEFYTKVNRKYIKLIFRDTGGQKSVHAFIDRTTGDVYKPASWQAPAKHVRYNVLDEESRERLYEQADWAGGYLYL